MQKHTPQPVKKLLRYAALTAAALLLVAFFRLVVRVNETTVALSFLMLVMVAASRWRLQYSVYLSILCTLLYNFFFLPPVGRFTIEDPRNWVALAAFLAGSVLVSQLSEQVHRQAEAAEQRRLELERLYEFSQQLLLQEDPRRLARSTPSAVAAAFRFRAVALYLRDEDASYSSGPDGELPSTVDLKLTASQPESAVVQRDGLWLVPLSLGMRSLGVLAVIGEPYSPQMYEAIGSLVAIALERAAALARSNRLEASRESERLRSALLDSVTHDLRTPLTSIRAAATTLVSQPELPDVERAELQAVVDEESARLDRLIGQAVEMAQLDAKAVTLHLQPQNVRALLETVAEELRALLRRHPVTIDAPDSLPVVLMDRDLVRRALRHLLENAAKYSPPGSAVVLSAACDDDRLLLSVADRGSGIDSDEQPFVFDKFFRGRQPGPSARGTGMGLAIVKSIMAAHGGGVALSSRPEQGACFTLWIPVQRVQAQARQQGAPKERHL